MFCNLKKQYIKKNTQTSQTSQSLIRHIMAHALGGPSLKHIVNGVVITWLDRTSTKCQSHVKAPSSTVPHLQTIHIHIHMAPVTTKDFSQVKYLWPPHASCDAGIWCEIAPRWERDLTVAALALGLKTRSGDPGPSPPKKCGLHEELI